MLSQVWTISADDEDELMDEDELLNEEDLKPTVKKVREKKFLKKFQRRD